MKGDEKIYPASGKTKIIDCDRAIENLDDLDQGESL